MGNWGFYLLFDPRLQEWKDEFNGGNIWNNPNKHLHTKRAQVLNMIHVLVLMRVLVSWLLVLFFIGWGIYQIFLLGSNTVSSGTGSGDSKLNRIPIINSFLKSHARKYDPKRPGEINVTECAICFDEFSATDKRDLVELDCNSNHIFHLDCIKEWV